MADVSVKMGVSGIAQFKQGMTDAAASVKTLDAALKTNEKQLQAPGDKEAFLASQSNLLKGKIEALKTVAKNAEQALKQMEANGVSKTSKAYQDMQRKLVEAQGSILDTQQDIQSLGSAAEESAGKTDKLATSLGGLNKKVSLEQVIGAIGSITNAMEKAAGKAVDLGKKLWENITDVARYSDDVATQAMVLNMDVEDYQKMKAVFDTVGELTVQEWTKAKKKVQQAIYDPTDDQNTVLELLGIKTHDIEQGKYGAVQGAARDFEEVFWEIGETLRRKVESGELTEGLAESYSNAIFGKSYDQLNPMFALGKKGFEEEMKKQAAASKEAIEANAKLNDELIKLNTEFTALKTEVVGGLAPALTAGAEAIGKVLDSIMEYLEKPEGQEMLQRLGESVSGLFDDLTKVNPEDVVNNFISIFDKLTSGLEFIKDHWSEIVTGIEAIGVAFASLKIAEGVLEGLRLISGLKGMFGGASGAEAGGLLGGIGGKLLATGAGVGVTGALATGAAALTMFDPTGLTALIPSVMEDQTAFLRTLRNGGSLEEAAAESGKAVEEAFNGAKKAWADWGNDIIEVPKKLAQSVWKDLFGGGSDEPKAEVKVEPKTDEEAAAMISAQIGTVSVPVRLVIQGGNSSKGPNGALGIGGGGGGMMDYYYEQVFGGFATGFANGLPLTPFDGWYYLHKNERVTPAREVSNRSYNSNLYVENMNMSGGMDAQALAAAMSAQNRRISAGYGS